MTPELKARIEAILVEPEKASDQEINELIEDIKQGFFYWIGDPREWWKLAKEKHIQILWYNEGVFKPTVSFLKRDVDSFHTNLSASTHGRAVCLAWLTMKLEESR